jgi:hypothetical protein
VAAALLVEYGGWPARSRAERPLALGPDRQRGRRAEATSRPRLCEGGSAVSSPHGFTLCPAGDLIDLGLGARPRGAK